MALVAASIIAGVPETSAILDIAPAGGLSQLIRTCSRHTYVSIDLDPVADGRLTDLRADVIHLPFRTGSVGFLLCSHVLEHVPDDRSAALELRRVLGPDGAILIQVPRRRGAHTDEHLSLTPSERLERYGQADHVRLYGDDFEERLISSGLTVATTSYSRLLPRPLLETIGVTSDHELWIASKGGDPARLIDPDAIMRLLAISMLASGGSPDPSQVFDLERQLQATRMEAEAWRAHYEWLRSRWPIRAATSLKRVATAPFRRDG